MAERDMRWWCWLPLAMVSWFPLDAHAALISGSVYIDILGIYPGDAAVPPYCGQGPFGDSDTPCGLGRIDIVARGGGKLLTYDLFSDRFGGSGLAHDTLAGAVDTYNIRARGEAGLAVWQANHPMGVAYVEFVDTFEVPPVYVLYTETASGFTQFRDVVTNTFFPGSRGFWQTGDLYSNFTVDFTVLSVEGLPVGVPEPSGLIILLSAFGLGFGFNVASRRWPRLIRARKLTNERGAMSSSSPS